MNCADEQHKAESASNLLLWSDVTVMTTLSLSAVHSLNWKSSITLSANHLFALELSGKSGEIRLDFHGSHTATSESQNQMEGGLLLDIVVREGSSIFELLSSEDEPLLIWRNTFFILDLGPKQIKRGLVQVKKWTYLTFSMVSAGSTSRVIVFPVRVLTKIYIFIYLIMIILSLILLNICVHSKP